MQLSTTRPTILFVNGNPSYTIHVAEWGFFMTCEDDMAVWALMSPGALRLTDLKTIVVDCREFKSKTGTEQMRHVRDAVSGRVSRKYSSTIAAAIDWWLETQARENDNQSP